MYFDKKISQSLIDDRFEDCQDVDFNPIASDVTDHR